MSAQPQGARQTRGSAVAGALLTALALCMALLTAGDPSSAAPPASAPAPAPAPAPGALTAILLVARPSLQDDGIFSDAVVLVMNNLGPDPVGVVVNKPTSLPVSRLFPEMKGLDGLPDRIYFGGPVELDSLWFLVRASSPPREAFPTCPGLYISNSRTLLLSLLARRHPMENLRIFIGHSGWGPGQLQDEIAAGAWKLQEAKAATIFATPEHPWPGTSEPKNTT
jgi:putative transcriptional regulator